MEFLAIGQSRELPLREFSTVVSMGKMLCSICVGIVENLADF